MPIRKVGSDDADERERHHRIGDEAVPPDRGINAERDAHDRREDRREHGELDGCGQALGDHRRDRPALAVGDAEIALRGLAKKAKELDREGLVEAEMLRQLLAVGHARLLPDHVGDRIADEPEHREGDEGDGDEHHRALEETAKDVGEHWSLRPSSAAGAEGGEPRISGRGRGPRVGAERRPETLGG